jgi:hypothetical protein
MQFKCNIGKLGVQQLALASVVNSLFAKQSMDCVITWLEPMTFELKNNMPETVAKRLLAEKVQKAIPGYVGEIKEGKLVVSKKSKESD